MNVTKSLLIIFIFSGCAHLNKSKQTQTMQYNQTVGESLVAHNYGNIYFSGQPSSEDIKKLEEQGFKQIINLRGQKEKDYDEKSQAKMMQKNNINYSHIPMDLTKPLSNEYINKVTKQVRAARARGKVLIHCSSGQRVALWTGAHFYNDHGYSKEEVELMTLKMGLEKEELKKKLRAYTAK